MENQMNQVEAREALVDYVSENSCWGSKPALQMEINLIVTKPVYQYELGSFIERRRTLLDSKPYVGGEVDGRGSGPAVQAWDIGATPKLMFQTEEQNFVVPRTSSVRTCYECRGNKGFTCAGCRGKGSKRCWNCNGFGLQHWIRRRRHSHRNEVDTEICYVCVLSPFGIGRLPCEECNSTGSVRCRPCDGYGQLLTYTRLNVKWQTTKTEKIVGNNSSLPEDIIRQAPGQVVVKEEGPRVAPLNSFSDSAVRSASTQLITDHVSLGLQPNQKMIAQRQQVRMIPVTEVQYTWKGKKGSYYICGIGRDRQVHAPDYPRKRCFGCC